MRKFIAMAMLMVVTMTASAQSVVRNGNTFSAAPAQPKERVKDTVVTKYTYQTRNGKEYKIIVNRKSGSCYIYKPGMKTPRQYMNKEIKAQICKEMGITIKSK